MNTVKLSIYFCIFFFMFSLAYALPTIYNPFTSKLDYWGIYNFTCPSNSWMNGYAINGTQICTSISVGSVNYSNYANNSFYLNEQNQTYYRNASNINAGTIGYAYLPSLDDHHTHNASNITSGTFNGNYTFSNYVNYNRYWGNRYFTSDDVGIRIAGDDGYGAHALVISGRNHTSGTELSNKYLMIFPIGGYVTINKTSIDLPAPLFEVNGDARISSLSTSMDASNITSGTILFARLPNLNDTHIHNASNITSGSFTGIFTFSSDILIGSRAVNSTMTIINDSAQQRDDWTTHNNYPTGCAAASYISTIGDTLTCSIPPGVSNAHTHDSSNITNEIWVNQSGDTMWGNLVFNTTGNKIQFNGISSYMESLSGIGGNIAGDFNTTNETEFNEGTYTNTHYNTSSSTVKLNGSYGIACSYDSGIVSHWSFDNDTTPQEDVYDGNNGTLINSPTWNASGVHNGALNFDGTDDGMTIADLNETTFTIIAWFKPDTWVEYVDILNHYNFAVPDTGFLMERESGSGLIYFYSVPGYAHVDSLAPLSIGVWQMVTGTFNGTHYALYINGTLQGTMTGGYTAPNVVIGIGHAPGQSDTKRFFNGVMDEVAFYNRSLTQTEIEIIYNTTYPCVGAGTASFTEGNYTSKVFDASVTSTWNNITFNAENVTDVMGRSCNDASCSGESFSSLGNTSPATISDINNRYFQYKFLFVNTTLLYNTTINYVTASTQTIYKLLSGTTEGGWKFIYNTTDEKTALFLNQTGNALFDENVTADNFYGNMNASYIQNPYWTTTATFENENTSIWTSLNSEISRQAANNATQATLISNLDSRESANNVTQSGQINNLQTQIDGIQTDFANTSKAITWNGQHIFNQPVFFRNNVTLQTANTGVVNETLIITDLAGTTKILFNGSGDSYFNSSSGKVGIGTTTPSTTLMVDTGDVNLADGIDLRQGGAQSGRLFFTSGTQTNWSMYTVNGAIALNYNAIAGSSTGTQALTYSSGGVMTIKGVDSDNSAYLVQNSSSIARARLGDSGATNDGALQLYKSDATQTVLIRADGSSYLNGGNVGVGIASPGFRLNIFDSNADIVGIQRNSSATTAGIGLVFRAYDNETIAQDYAKIYGIITNNNNASENGSISFNTATSGTVTEKVRINNLGYMGIGTTTPSQTLHVIGNMNITGNIINPTTSKGIELRNETGDPYCITMIGSTLTATGGVCS